MCATLLWYPHTAVPAEIYQKDGNGICKPPLESQCIRRVVGEVPAKLCCGKLTTCAERAPRHLALLVVPLFCGGSGRLYRDF
jgi:hypothetical protein